VQVNVTKQVVLNNQFLVILNDADDANNTNDVN